MSKETQRRTEKSEEKGGTHKSRIGNNNVTWIDQSIKYYQGAFWIFQNSLWICKMDRNIEINYFQIWSLQSGGEINATSNKI